MSFVPVVGQIKTAKGLPLTLISCKRISGVIKLRTISFGKPLAVIKPICVISLVFACLII